MRDRWTEHGKGWRVAFPVFVAGLLCPLICVAQGSGVEQAIRQLERAQQLQQQQLERDSNQNRNQSNPFEREPVKQGSGPRGQLQAGQQPCRVYEKIEVEGASHLLHFDRDRLLEPYQGTCLTPTQADDLAASISKQYIERGYITTHAYVAAPAKEAPETLKILVVEGVLEGYRVDEDQRRRIPVATLFPFTVGRTLNLRDIEEGIDHLNALPSNNVTAQIEPGTGVGTSVVRLENRPQPPWRAFLSADTYGNAATGRVQGTAGFTLDNPLGLADALSTSIRRSSPWNPEPFRSTSFSSIYNVPFGSNMFSLGWQTSNYSQSVLLPSGLAVRANGTSEHAFGKWEHLLFRNQNLQLSFETQLRVERNANYFATQQLALQSPSLTVLDLDAELKHRFFQGWLSADVGVSAGLRALGATADSDSLPRAQFSMVRATASANTPFSLFGGEYAFSSSLNGQWSPDPLYPTAQILIGGPYTVRGYQRNTAAGSTGIYGRNELSLILRQSVYGVPIICSPYVALDGGRIWRAHSSNDSSAFLIGTAIGVRVSSGRVSFDAFYSMPSPWPRSLPREKGLFYLQLSINV